VTLRRRDFITLVGGAAAAWPLAARAQQAMPVIGFVSGAARETAGDRPIAFRRGLSENGYVEGQNVTVEYHWLDGRYESLPALMADLVRRRVAVIATPGSAVASLAAKAATATIPIVFGVPDNPVGLGLVASLARPGGNATGTNFLFQEVGGKRLALLHELVPKAARVAVLVNPNNAPNTETALREMPDAARVLSLQTLVLNASTVGEIDEAFATLAREGADALYIGSDAFFDTRRLQIALLAARNAIPTSVPDSESVRAGALMSYGTDIVDVYRQVGVYAGRILKGAKPAELPVEQATKLELVINLVAAKAIGVEVPPSLLARADEVIE
jgi:putative ABC transport system substrate-binding protein